MKNEIKFIMKKTPSTISEFFNPLNTNISIPLNNENPDNTINTKTNIQECITTRRKESVSTLPTTIAFEQTLLNKINPYIQRNAISVKYANMNPPVKNPKIAQTQRESAG